MGMAAPSHLPEAILRFHKFCFRILGPKQNLEQKPRVRTFHSTLVIIRIDLPAQDQRLPLRRVLEHRAFQSHRHLSGVLDRIWFQRLLRRRIQSPTSDAEESEVFFGQHFGHFETM